MTTNGLGRKAWLALGVAGLLAACSDRSDRQAKAPPQAGPSQTASGQASTTLDGEKKMNEAPASPGAQRPGQQAAPGERTAQTSSPSGSQSEKTVSGKVVRVSQQELVLRPSSGGQDSDLRLKVSSSTPITIDGRQGSATDLKEGTQVRASYQESGGAPMATKIEAQSSASGSQPGQSGQK
jgi:colicin import membrane protein